MKKKETASSELIALIHEIKTAYKLSLASDEFKTLEKDFARGTKIIAQSVRQAFQAAQKSPETARLKTQIKKVAKTTTKAGRLQAHKAQQIITRAIAKARKTIRHR